VFLCHHISIEWKRKDPTPQNLLFHVKIGKDNSTTILKSSSIKLIRVVGIFFSISNTLLLQNAMHQLTYIGLAINSKHKHNQGKIVDNYLINGTCKRMTHYSIYSNRSLFNVTRLITF
jgi:hypothetical protein